ncbi:phage major capsid protein [Xanthobacter autotrophicus]|uniref:phage major capsid protein n=1 Tax=Xanthobacter autotrophicus TaxID=280 RepID=UPI0024A75F58|nr:phage major capsid protein [Xanthobacter autotrophicus]MDI4657245.1 phage major capsid protein [Xanthobacter autotrophicus]
MQLSGAFDDFKRRQNGRLENVEASIDGFQGILDDIAAKEAARVNAGGGAHNARPVDPEYTKLYASWFRYGQDEREVAQANRAGERARVNAAMTVGSNNDGGYLAPTEWDRTVLQQMMAISPMRQIAYVVPTTVNAYATIWSDRSIGTGWMGETAARSATSTPQVDPVTYTHGELYAYPFITQTLLDDAQFDIVQWLADTVAEEMDRQEGIAFLSGDGQNKPRGLLTFAPGGLHAASHPGGALAVVNSGHASQLTADGLINLSYGLQAPYRRNATWLMASTTAAVIRKMKDGQGNYLWQPVTVAGQPETLLGYPVAIDENMPSVAADALPVAFGDFQRGYVINDRSGVRVLRDPYSNKPYVGFYTTKRVGGGVRDPNAIVLQKVGA